MTKKSVTKRSPAKTAKTKQAIATAKKVKLYKNPIDKISRLGEEDNTLDWLEYLRTEDVLDVNVDVVDPETGNEEINYCKDCLKRKGIKFLNADLQIDTIALEYKGFRELFLEATSLVDQAEGTGHITGLRIYFGLDSGGKIKLLYRAIGMVGKQNIGKYPVVTHREYIVYESENFYEYIDNAFYVTTDITCLDRYKDPRSGISIKHVKDGELYEPFQYGIDPESVTFSFQEIFALIYDNINAYEKSGEKSLKDCNIWIYNSIRTINEGGIEYLKHTLLLAPPDLFIPSLFDFKGAFANLAHLCPPHCASLVYKLE